MWKEENNSLYRKFQFKDFKEAFAFLTKVAMAAEQVNHHPTIKNTWNTVELGYQRMMLEMLSPIRTES